MGIEYDLNTKQIWLEEDTATEPKELKKEIYKSLKYLQDQSKRLQSRNREILLIDTVRSMIKLYNEYPMMIEGRNNNEPF